MTQSELTSSDLPTPSPCINVCKINQTTGLCEGCWRTLDEIAAWGTASEPAKKVIWQKIYQRQANSG